MGDTVETKRAHGRSLADFWLDGEEGKLHPAERRIVDACAKGETAEIGGHVPEGPGPDNFVRAGLLRFLALGGDAATPRSTNMAWGLWARGSTARSILRLRETGHPNAARKVAIAKQEQMRVAGRFAGIRRPIHRLYGAFVGYGYRPERLLYAMSALWLGFGLVFLWGSADHVGRIAPGPTLFLNAPEPRDVPRHSPLHDFDPWRWSLDALLPIDLGYTATAHPDEARWQGRVLGWMAVFETLFGWIASLLLVASVTNLLKKD